MPDRPLHRTNAPMPIPHLASLSAMARQGVRRGIARCRAAGCVRRRRAGGDVCDESQQYGGDVCNESQQYGGDVDVRGAVDGGRRVGRAGDVRVEALPDRATPAGGCGGGVVGRRQASLGRSPWHRHGGPVPRRGVPPLPIARSLVGAATSDDLEAFLAHFVETSARRHQLHGAAEPARRGDRRGPGRGLLPELRRGYGASQGGTHPRRLRTHRVLDNASRGGKCRAR